jgi:hypothetical protein
MEIKYINDESIFIETVSTWIFNEFVNGIRPEISFEMILSMFKNMNSSSIPLSLIALENQNCLGTISLVANDQMPRDYTPWLSALYVESNQRNKGIGKSLIKKAEIIARLMGFKILYLRTEDASAYYSQLGYNYIETTCDNFGIVVDIFCKKI